MAKISAALVKQLREKTGAGMGDCKKALVETDGDVEAAVDVLRSKGVKASQLTRETAEGAIRLDVAADGKSVAVVELRCETDFAARNENFLKLLEMIAGAVHESAPESLDAAKEIPAIKDGIQEAAAVKIRENIQLYSAERRELEGSGKIGSYVHHNGKVGVAVALNASSEVMGQEGFDQLLKDLCMHATAHHPAPAGIDRDSISPELVERERAVALKTIDEDPKMSAKPDEIKKKMVDGKLRKFFEERALLDQKFVKDPSLSIAKLVDAKAKELGGEIKIAWFVRQQVGS
ncbi:MAG: translation elongation factor Ts [Planctomycetes bacterium]|nr:translation elongation factor Ts [Planctomycetota bacterium]